MDSLSFNAMPAFESVGAFAGFCTSPEVKEGEALMAKVGSMSSGTCTCEARTGVCETKMHDPGACKG